MRTIRAAAHVHSDWSYDARWPLPDLARAFARRGYDVVLMAEHDRGFDAERWAAYKMTCAAGSSDRILLVPGMEYEDADNIVHVPVWGEEAPYLGHGRPTQEILEAARESDAVAVLAHPWRRDAVERFDPDWVPFLAAVEIWNRHYDGVAPNPEVYLIANDTRPPVSDQFNGGVRTNAHGILLTANYAGIRGRNDLTFLFGNRNPDGTCRVEYLPVTITRWPPGERVYGR